ncbi:hypothetical protein [Actinomadura vinacea]
MEHPKRAVVLWDLTGTLVENVPPGGTPRVDPGLREGLLQMGELYGVAGILTGWSVAQVDELDLTVRNCHILGQFGAEHWHNGVRPPLMLPPSGLSTAADKLHKVVKELGLDTRHIHLKAYMLAFRYAEDTDPRVVELLLAPLRKVAEAAGDLTLLHDPGMVRLVPEELDKGISLRRFLERLERIVPREPSAVMVVGDGKPDEAAMDELDRLRAEGVPTLKVGVGEKLRDKVDLFVAGPPQGALALIDAMCAGGAPESDGVVAD